MPQWFARMAASRSGENPRGGSLIAQSDAHGPATLGRDSSREVLRARDPFHHAEVHRYGEIVVKEVGPWGSAVCALLRHLAAVGFESAPRLADPAFNAQVRLQLEYIS